MTTEDIMAAPTPESAEHAAFFSWVTVLRYLGRTLSNATLATNGSGHAPTSHGYETDAWDDEKGRMLVLFDHPVVEGERATACGQSGSSGSFLVVAENATPITLTTADHLRHGVGDEHGPPADKPLWQAWCAAVEPGT